MEKPPAKKKKLVKSEEEDEEEEIALPSTVSSQRSDRRVFFAPIKETAKQPSEDPIPAKSRKPRLVMKKMVLNNFKSYAGRQVIGPFHKVRFIRITCGLCINLIVLVFQC